MCRHRAPGLKKDLGLPMNTFTKKQALRWVDDTHVAVKQALALMPIDAVLTAADIKDLRIIIRGAAGHCCGKHDLCAESIKAHDRLASRYQPEAERTADRVWCNGLDAETLEV